MADQFSPHNADGNRPMETDAGTLHDQLAQLRAQLEAARQKLEKMEFETLVDPLTGVCNRRAMENDLNQRLSEWHRYGARFSILMIDFDALKQVNDRCGHLAGDALLCHTAQLLKSQLRRCDLLYRLGGDEFVAILPNTDAKEAQIAAERLCHQVARQAIEFDRQSIMTSISIGIAEVEVNDTYESILQKADEMMYRGKSRGGNQCCRSAAKPADSLHEHPPE